MKSNPKNHLARLIFSTIVATAAFVFTASPVHAATNYQGPGDDWADSTKWSGGVVPAGVFNQRLNFNGGTAVTFTAAQGTVDAGAAGADGRSIVLGNVNPNASTGTATLNITGGILRAGTGAVATSLVGANGAASVGILNVSGGILDLTTATSSAGRVLAIGLTAGANSGISGTVAISGTGTVKVGEFRFNDSITNPGGITGVLTLDSGGTLETGAIREGASGVDQAAVTSSVNLNGGLLKLTGAAPGISASIGTLSVLSGGAKIEVVDPSGAALANGNFLDGGGGGGLIKTGDGILTMSGNNTYTGVTKINAGTLRFATQGSLYNNVSANWTAANINTLSGATFAVHVDSAGTAGFTNASLDTLLGNISVANSATEGLQAGASIGIDTSTATGASFTQGNVIADSTGANGGTIGLAKRGAGALVLDKANSYTGATSIFGGAVVVTVNNALGPVGGNTTVAPASSLALSGGIDYTTTETVTGSGIGSPVIAGVLPGVSRGLIQSASGNNTFRGNIVVNAGGTSRVGTQDGASLTLTGTITQATGSMLFRAGSGPLLPIPNTGGDFITLSNAGNSFGSDSTIFTGAATGYSGVRLGITNALPTGLTISGLGGGTPTAAGTALDLNGFNQTLNGLIGAAPLNIINTNTGTPSTLTLSPTADLTTAGTVILGGTGLSGTLGTINLIKAGTFSQTLAGVNTYTGTTAINGGTLVITGASLGTSAITFGGGTLGLDIATTVTAANATVNFTGQSVLVTGTPTLASYTLLTAFSIAPGNPTLAAPAPSGYSLQVVGNELRLVQSVGSAYNTWAIANAPSGGPGDDFDKDGVGNAVEFVLGGLATTNDLGKLPVIATSGGNMTFSFKRAQSSIDPKTSTTIEVSTDLVTWNTAPSPYAVPDGATAGPPIAVQKDLPSVGTDTITLTLPQSPDVKKFARLKVAITP